ncbi:MAG: hypothetical protein ACI9MX_000278, partial [Candidatus Aldehydirespiratoraceae bacterium]
MTPVDQRLRKQWGWHVKKKTFVGLIAVVAVLVPSTAWAAHSFTDVPDGQYFSEPVEWAAENGITTGKSATIFDPSGVVTRGEAVTFLKRYHDNIAKELDTLGALSCDAGEVPKSDGATGWTCAADIDTDTNTDTDTDTLATLSC